MDAKNQRLKLIFFIAVMTVSTASAPSADTIFNAQPYTVEYQKAPYVNQNISLQLPTQVTAGNSTFNDTTIILPPGDTPIDDIYIQEKFPFTGKWEGTRDLNCEKLAKEVQSLYGGSLIFLVGKDKSNNYILGEYVGHFLNKIYDKEQKHYWYIDYQIGQASIDLSDFTQIYKDANNYLDAEAYDLGERRPPFGMVWHY